MSDKKKNKKSDESNNIKDNDNDEDGNNNNNKKNHNKYRRDKPWDDENVDHWKVDKWNASGDNPDQLPGGRLLEESSFATLFPKYRENYLRQIWPVLTRTLEQAPYCIACELNLIEGSMEKNEILMTFWFQILHRNNMHVNIY